MKRSCQRRHLGHQQMAPVIVLAFILKFCYFMHIDPRLLDNSDLIAIDVTCCKLDLGLLLRQFQSGIPIF